MHMKYFLHFSNSRNNKIFICAVLFLSLLIAGKQKLSAQDFTNAIELDGNDSYVQANSVSAKLSLSSAFTFEAWVKRSGFTENKYVLSFHDVDKINIVLFGISASGKIMTSYHVPGTGDIETTGILSVPIGIWTHIALTVAVDNSVAVYVNGEPDPTWSSVLIPYRPVAGGYFSIGQDYDEESITNDFIGQVDEVRVWNVVRTQPEIQNSMNAELAGAEPGLIAYYKMLDGSGTSLTDDSGNGNTGTLVGNVTWINNPPTVNDDPALGSYEVYCGDTISGNVLNNDTDVERNDFQVAEIPTLAYGSFDTFNLETGDFVYQAPMDYTGGVTFYYQALDGALSDSAMVSISIVDTISPQLSCQNDTLLYAEKENCGATLDYSWPTASDNCTAYNNLLYSVDNAEGLDGWTIIQQTGNGWRAVEGAEGPKYQSSYDSRTSTTVTNRKSKEVSLLAAGYTKEYLDSAPSISVGEEIVAYLNNGDKDLYYVKYELRDEDHNIIASYSSGSRTSPKKVGSTPVKEEFIFTNYGSGVRYVYFEHGGLDAGFWEGYYGAAFYNCHIKLNEPQLAAGLSSGESFPIGTTTNVYEVSDVSGNISSCSFNVEVVDTLPPTIVVKNAIAYLDDSGQASIVSSEIIDDVSDNCEVDTMYISRNSFNSSDLGIQNVLVTALDIYGNKALKSAQVTVSDTILPSLTVPVDIFVYANADQCGTEVSFEGEVLATDNTGNVQVNQTAGFSSGSIFPVGETINTIEAVDQSGNKVVRSFKVRVEDNTNPVAIAHDVTIYLNANGLASLLVADIDDGSSDNCSIDTMYLSQDTFDCSYVDYVSVPGVVGLKSAKRIRPDGFAVSLTAKDPSDNTNTDWFYVSVKDTISPQVKTKDITVYLDESGLVVLDSLAVDDGSNDACGLAAFELNKDTFSCENTGDNIVFLTVTDIHGNSATESAQVTVLDTVPPTALCQDINVYLDESGKASIKVNDIDNGSFDACGIQSRSLSKTQFSPNEVGNHTVVLTVTDNHGNTSAGSSTVNVIDNIPPKVQCNTADFVISSGSYYVLTDEDIEALSSGTTDNVTAYEDLDIRVSPGKLTCSHEGGTVIKVYATDEAGNESMCMVIVGVTIENSSPAINPIADVTTDEDVPVSIALSGISSGKICDRATTVTASHNGGNLISDLKVTHTSSEATGTLDVELMADQNGTAEVTVEVANNDGDKTTANFMLTVNPVNDAPVLVQSIPDQGVRATDSLEISISKILGVLFDDVDDSTLTYNVSFESGTLPDWINVTDDPDVYMLDFEPLQADTGCCNIIVKATDPAGATASDTFELCVDRLIVGITDLEAGVFEVSLYPNPTAGKVMVEHNVGTSDEMEISVMSVSGSEVFRKNYRIGEDPVTFNLSDQVSGMYMVLIKVNDKVVIKKLILDRK